MRIKITGVDLVEFTKKVYELSVPQGLGFMQFTDNPLDTKEAEELINTYKNDGYSALSLDYIHGRACKMIVFKENNELFINSVWYDHTDEQLKQLLNTFNITVPVSGMHGIAYNCSNCQINRNR